MFQAPATRLCSHRGPDNRRSHNHTSSRCLGLEVVVDGVVKAGVVVASVAVAGVVLAGVVVTGVDLTGIAWCGLM